MKAAVGLRLEELRQHRTLLVERAELQRGELGKAFAELERPFHWFSIGLMAAGWLRNPAVAGLSAAGVVTLLGKLRHWISRGLLAWQLFQAVRRHIPERHEADVNETPT